MVGVVWVGVDRQKVDLLTGQNVTFKILAPPAFQNIPHIGPLVFVFVFILVFVFLFVFNFFNGNILCLFVYID